MFRSAIKLLSFTSQRFALHPSQSIVKLINHQNLFNFSKENKEGTRSNPQQQHVHGPGCNHGHHEHEQPHEPSSTNINVKLSKLSFEQLIELNNEDSLRYANLIIQQQSKRLQTLIEDKNKNIKNLQFYKVLQDQNKEKEKKLAYNIKIYQQEAQLSEKRAAKQVQESKSYAVTKIAKELLEVADCIANCKKFAHQEENKTDKYIDLIIDSENVIKKILKEYEIEQFDPINKDFDANFQQSLLQIPTPPGFKTGTVAMTMRTGYTIHGRLLRSARVGVFS